MIASEVDSFLFCLASYEADVVAEVGGFFFWSGLYWVATQAFLDDLCEDGVLSAYECAA